MKKILLVILSLSIFIACSSDDTSEKKEDVFEEKFQLDIDGEQFPIITWTAGRHNDLLVIIGETVDRRVFDFTIKTNGHILLISHYWFDPPQSPSIGGGYSTPFDSPSPLFEIFDLNLDEDNKTIQFSFKGTLYADAEDFNSESILVNNGVLALKYEESDFE